MGCGLGSARPVRPGILFLFFSLEDSRPDKLGRAGSPIESSRYNALPGWQQAIGMANGDGCARPANAALCAATAKWKDGSEEIFVRAMIEAGAHSAERQISSSRRAIMSIAASFPILRTIHENGGLESLLPWPIW